MISWLVQGIFKTTGLKGCSYQNWSKERQLAVRPLAHKANWWAWGEKARSLVWFHRCTTVVQIAKNVHAGYDRKVSEHTVEHSLFHRGLCSCRRTEWTPVHHHLPNWTIDQGDKVARYDENLFFKSCGRIGACVSLARGKRWHQDALWEKDKLAEAVWCHGQCTVEKPWFLHSCGFYWKM